MKKRNEKELQYETKYNAIPRDYLERLNWLYDTLKITDKKADQIIAMRERMMQELYYTEIFIVLYEVPEGSPRPRFRLINRKNLANAALANPNFVHVYSITGAEDNKFMNRILTEQDFTNLNSIIYTPCDVLYTTFFQTPKYYNAVETYLAEIGMDMNIYKPDWDNIGKKYSDMSNSNIWLDDSLVIRGTVEKYYSVLPRIEIRLRYLNMLYNRHQYKSISKRYDGEVKYFK
jgi:Holliday junction resolvase RusA-like endonuclease